VRRHHVALVDPIPAGLEALNETAQSKSGRYWYWSRTWYEHQTHSVAVRGIA
jgi:alpha-2-macroglobulin